MEKEETRAERALRLTAEVGRLIPELNDEQVRMMVGPVLDQAMSLTKETEEHFQVGKRTLDASAVISVMIQGALAAICEGHPDEDIRGRLYRAGKLVGEYATERMAKNVEAAVEAQAKATLS